ncbi:vitamin K epoxide reductase family protein [Nocardiopsis sp. RSe5-2]|uniref:Vitamin K epoxide reductase family protein n=1 Tax=Nocardiopsis endophytica TaxID=3018445 RepID=A0ABT4U6E7_9ACTN|nr:vitamin K epoxide reductase family protein [Nocardiopsis endophytica]MDA2812516.1 vitamin K epoxide reductase family protein [Nocardiopsis endophytica]
MSAQKAAAGSAAPSPAPSPEPPGAEVPIMGRALPWILAVGGGIGLLAAFALAVEKVNSLANPDYVPTCSVNPVISCGTVMDTPTAEVFGFPNPLLGIACFAIVTAIGMAMLSGASFRPWFWWGLQGGVIFGIGFVHFLIFQSLYKISALCPYCMVVWAVMIPIFSYVTLDNVRTGRIPLPAGARSAAGVLIRNHTVVVTVWYLLIIAAIAQAFWSFWTGQI